MRLERLASPEAGEDNGERPSGVLYPEPAELPDSELVGEWEVKAARVDPCMLATSGEVVLEKG